RYTLNKFSRGCTKRKAIAIEVKELSRNFVRDVARPTIPKVERYDLHRAAELPVDDPLHYGCFVGFVCAQFAPDAAIAANLIKQQIRGVAALGYDAGLH